MFQKSQNAGIDIAPSTAHNALQNVDALFQGDEGVPLPSSVFLDYFYGIVAYNAWGSSNRGDGFNKIKAYREEHYANIPPRLYGQPDDCNDSDAKYNLYKHLPRKRPRRKSGMEETMDELNIFLMYLHGITPERAAESRQKEIEQEEQEVGRSKVMEWRNHLDVH